jgi:hypothetical protein
VSIIANRLFLREAELIVGTKGLSTRANTIPGDARIIRTRIKFSIEKNSESNANKGTITVYNLSQETRNFLEKKDAIAMLKAGFRDFASTIFLGDILKGMNKRQGPDVVTDLECGDGEFALKTALLNVSFGPGVKNTQIIDAAVAAITQYNVVKGFRETIPVKTYQQGFSFSGQARDALKQQLLPVGLEFHIQDGELSIIKPDGTNKELAVLVSQDTGLVGFPTKTALGVEFTCLLNPQLRPGRAVKLESKQFQGAFGRQANIGAASLIESGDVVRVRRVVHEGDTGEGTWLSRVECVKIGAPSG